MHAVAHAIAAHACHDKRRAHPLPAQVKRVVAPGAAPEDSLLVQGVVCRKTLAHKRMRSSVAQPRIMLLAGGLEAARAPAGGAPAAGGLAGLGGLGGLGGGAASQSKLSSFDAMLDTEQQYLGTAVDRIASYSPDVLLVERSVARCVDACWLLRCRCLHACCRGGTCRLPAARRASPLVPAESLVPPPPVLTPVFLCIALPACACRYAQELLLAKDISLVLNVKPALLERIARCTGAQVRAGGSAGGLEPPWRREACCNWGKRVALCSNNVRRWFASLCGCCFMCMQLNISVSASLPPASLLPFHAMLVPCVCPARWRPRWTSSTATASASARSLKWRAPRPPAAPARQRRRQRPRPSAAPTAPPAWQKTWVLGPWTWSLLHFTAMLVSKNASLFASSPAHLLAPPPPPGHAPPQAQHLVADAAALFRRSAGSSASTRALMSFRGCPRPLGSTVVLRGGDGDELRRVKRVVAFAAYAAYWGQLEAALLANQLAAAATAVLPGSGGAQPEAVAGLADAVASTSFLATAEARGRQAVMSASPHVSVVLEPGVSGEELELPAGDGGAALAEAEAAAQQLDQQQRQQRQQEEEQGGGEAAAGEAAGGEEWEASGPASDASSDSANMWVLPAEAGAATFTVSGSQSDSAAGTPARSASGVALQPESPKDPLHQAAKELALQQLQLTGSEPPSPGGCAAAAASAPNGDTPAGQQQQQQQQQAPPVGLASRGSEVAAAAAQPSHLSAAGPTGEDSSRLSEPSVDGGLAAGAPGLAAYRAQRLWLSISCKNPAKSILCEPAHAHCMEFYADTGEEAGATWRAGAGAQAQRQAQRRAQRGAGSAGSGCFGSGRPRVH